MDNTCFLCRSVIKNEMINLKDKKTIYTNIDLLEFLQSIVPNACLIEHCDKNICHVCFTLINDLDLSRKKCLDLTQLLSSYLDNRQIIKTENEENFIQSDLFFESITIKEEINTEEYETDNVENESEKIDLIKSEGVFDENDSEKNLWISNECSFCQKNFNSLNDLVLHIRKSHQDDNIDQKLTLKDNVVDPICPENGNETETNISEKNKSTDKKENNCPKLYKCDECGKSFITSYKLKRHIATHSNPKSYVCETCGLSYKHKAALDVHIGMHNGINPLTCIYCNKTFTEKKSLQMHMPLHKGECQRQCDICGKRFSHRNSFRFHLASHSENKSFKCELCGAVFNIASHLKRHMKVHTGEKKFECPTCEKKFAEGYNLIAHMKIHEKRTNEYKHICEICNMGFHGLSKLKKHKIATH